MELRDEDLAEAHKISYRLMDKLYKQEPVNFEPLDMPPIERENEAVRYFKFLGKTVRFLASMQKGGGPRPHARYHRKGFPKIPNAIGGVRMGGEIAKS